MKFKKNDAQFKLLFSKKTNLKFVVYKNKNKYLKNLILINLKFTFKIYLTTIIPLFHATNTKLY